jgi:hypothetical protein
MLFCVGTGFAVGRAHIQGVLQNVYATEYNIIKYLLLKIYKSTDKEGNEERKETKKIASDVRVKLLYIKVDNNGHVASVASE